MDIAEIMTGSPVTVGPPSPADEALRLMADRGVRHLPVMDGSSLVGIVSERDLLAAVGWLVPDGPVPQSSLPSPRSAVAVADVMRPEPLTVTPDDTVVSACVILQVERIGCLPVVDESGQQLLGIVTEMDVLAAYARACREGRLDGDVDPPLAEHMSRDVAVLQHDGALIDAVTLCRAVHGRHLPIVEDGRLVGIVSDRDLRAALGAGRGPEEPVAGFMARDVVTIGSDARLSEAAAVMSEHRFGALPVMEAGRLVGIVTLTDVVEHCIESLREPDPGRGA
jgi:CBS domain-containing protein